MELPGELEVDVGEVNEDGNVWPAASCGLLELSKLAVDAGQVTDHFRDAHHGHVFGADQPREAGSGPPIAAHAEERRGVAAGGELALERLNEQSTVVLATGLACGDKEVVAHAPGAAFCALSCHHIGGRYRGAGRNWCAGRRYATRQNELESNRLNINLVEYRPQI